MANITSTPKTYRAGDRVEIIAVAGIHPYFAGEKGTVWYGERSGAVVHLDSRREADTRFTAAELRPAQ
jgi:ribosomal protein L21E